MGLKHRKNGRKGGILRWAGVSKKKRSEIMRLLAYKKHALQASDKNNRGE